MRSAIATRYREWRNVSSRWMDEGAGKLSWLTTQWAKVAVATLTLVGLAVHALSPAKQPRGTTRVVLWHKAKRLACFSVQWGRSDFERACSSSRHIEKNRSWSPSRRVRARREVCCTTRMAPASASASPRLLRASQPSSPGGCRYLPVGVFPLGTRQ
jgi:hypothetical protein